MCAARIHKSIVGASPLEEGQKQKVTERSLELRRKAKVASLKVVERGLIRIRLAVLALSMLL